MPLPIPTIDDLRYQDLVDEALARIPVHSPEWTNFNDSDPGVTLIQVFSFLTENLIYRANLIPERNRLKFLSLLGVPLQPASAAQGLVQFKNSRGPLEVISLNSQVEVSAGQIPFRTTMGLDVLPLSGQVFYKHRLANPDPELVAYYEQLYASYYDGQKPFNAENPLLYETRPLPPEGIDLANTVDRAIWIALLTRPGADVDQVRRRIEGKVLNLGLVPLQDDTNRDIIPGGQLSPEADSLLSYRIPSGRLTEENRTPQYRLLPALPNTNVLLEPGIVQITLPNANELTLWDNLDPLEAGVGDFPPALEDTALNTQLVTWLQISSSAAVQARILWAGINTTPISQRAEINNEQLLAGTGEPDQVRKLAQKPVIPGSVQMAVTTGEQSQTWAEIDDLAAAGPEVPTNDPRKPPGVPMSTQQPSKVYKLVAEAGEIYFGDGTRGARPPFNAQLRASYAVTAGAAGNVGPAAVNSAPVLPAGLQVENPVATWGGADVETVAEGEKQITRYLQHRDRLVSVEDFRTITLRTPGVQIGRVEVLPAFNPNLDLSDPGGAPGAVTVMAIPQYDPQWPQAPQPDTLFLDTICRYIDPRRLVSTEVFLRGPRYKDIWVSVGITVPAEKSLAEVSAAMKAELTAFLSPLPRDKSERLGSAVPLFTTPAPNESLGWPLRKTVIRLELLAVATRVPDVLLVNGLVLVDSDGNSAETIPIEGLEMPRLRGISVVAGQPLPADQLPGRTASLPSDNSGIEDGQDFVPLPVIAEDC